MICEFCGGETVSKKVRKIHWFRRKLYIVDDVEAEVCRECGERYYHATTLDAIDQLLESGKPVVKEQLQVQVIGMPAYA
ncbi:MAG: YgiT-type zinc finger protein [Chloroflexi bacterium]|nr:YgiT-type zinc finger protein [Chloroflexota bacterium]